MDYNTLIKTCENEIDENLSTLKDAAKLKHSIDATRFLIENLNLKEEDVESKYPEIYFNMKIAFYNKGFIIGSWTHIQNGKKFFDIRYRIPEDKPPICLSDFKCQKIIMPNDVIKVMEETKNLTSQDGLERGFFLLYGEDCIIFPTQIHTGLCGDLSCPPIPHEGYAKFGFFHTHPAKYLLEEGEDFRKLLLEHNINIMPSPNDILIAINDYLDEKYFNHSAMIILSPIGNKGLILTPRRNLPDIIYKNILNILSKKLEDRNLTIIFNDLVRELFHISEFYIPFEGDVVIEYSNGEYRLEGDMRVKY